ncbi:MAG TPA: methionyl-tRNA formyltransferase [Candidatus Gracilibacteria bacterium]|nr:methionyl-tRNA formyltransferase [Candidatus Gracilibacteria bacterium]
MKIYYFGTPKFAVPSLRALAMDPYFEILGVVTMTSKKGDRNTIMEPAIKEIAEKLNLPVIQKDKIDEELIDEIKKNKPDYIVVVAYGGIIPKALLEFPCINVHPSLLPRYRGASPIQEALLNGDEDTGVSIMKIDDQLDHGDIYLVRRYPIEKDDTYETLSQRLAEKSAEILPFALRDIESGILEPIKQSDSKATFCRKIEKEEGLLDFSKTSEELINQIRALNPWPSTYTKINDKILKILEARSIELESKEKTGTAILIDKNTFGFKTQNGILIPTLVQLEGKKPTSAKDFLNGYKNLLFR